MKNLSRYQLIIKNEQCKVKDVVGICTNKYKPDNTVQDDLDLIQNLYNRANNNDVNTFVDPSGRRLRCNGNAEAENIEFNEVRNVRERRRNRKRRRTDTNVYRFENQSLAANSLGKSNRLVERSRRAERSTINEILKKYMRTNNF